MHVFCLSFSILFYTLVDIYEWEKKRKYQKNKNLGLYYFIGIKRGDFK